MRTIVIIIGGILLLGICIVAARLFGSDSKASKRTAVNVFIALWLVLAASNMLVGMYHAGYSFADELPIFLVIFLLPAGIALFMQRKLSSGKE